MKPDNFTDRRSTLAMDFTLPGTNQIMTLGGSSELWGGVDMNGDNTKDRDWAPADFDANFGVGIFIGAGPTASCTASIDSISLRVFYQAA